jgi:hypothetical protein
MVSSSQPGFLAAGPPAPLLPYPPLTPELQRVIRAAVGVAWRVVLREIVEGRCDRTGEVSITIALERALNHLLDEEPSFVPGFSASIFETLVRGGEVVNYNRTSVEKRPDLTFRPAGHAPSGVERTQYGMFVECKLVDAKHSRRSYGDQGILRFVRGEYAWAMPHAMMIGYVATETHRAEDFPQFLKKHRSRYQLEGDATLEDMSSSPREVTIRSKHARQWRYPQNNGEPGKIDILHCWLSMS